MASIAAPPSLTKNASSDTLAQIQDLGLITPGESAEALGFFADAFPFTIVVPHAMSLHVHLKVDATDTLSRARLIAAGGRPESEKAGYVKFAFPSGINVIFSSIDVAQDDLIPNLSRPEKPFLDHWGIDLRNAVPAVRAAYDTVPTIARGLGWSVASQGGPGKPVACCHTLVAEKHWVYPRTGGRSGAPPSTRPIEFAYGPLTISSGAMGCDLRPIDPAHPEAGRVPACHAAGDAAPAPAFGGGYYQPSDLARFGDMARFATPLMDKFLDYYNAVTATDGALTKREKALIALAVAHSKQCPYCIDAYTGQCLANGSTPEQMHEAVHVAAALGAGIDLIHGVQMQNAMRAKSAI